MSTRLIRLSAALLALTIAGCASTTPPPANANKQAKAKPAPAPTPPPTAAPAAGPDRAPDAANDVSIGSLAVDDSKVVRVRGRVASIKGMRLVPPSVIFTVTDKTGTATALIKEKKKPELHEGVQVELIGHFQHIDSPMHQGPGTPAKADILVVDRYLISP